MATKPCPCGYRGDEEKPCRCPEPAVERYTSRISGPLLDRIDLHVEVPRLPVSTWFGPGEEKRSEPSARVRERVLAAREIQSRRFAGRSSRVNARMTSDDLEEFCPLGPSERAHALRYLEGSDLTARGHKKLLAVARTLADLAGEDRVQKSHLAEAAALRRAIANPRA